MKRITTLSVKYVLAVLLGALLLSAHSATADQEGPYTYTVGSGTSTITDFDMAYSGALSITNALGGFPVTSIGNNAFVYCTRLTRVTIPDSVTSMGVGAFGYCTALTDITIPSNITSIGDYGFYYCTGLASIRIPGGVTSIGDQAFVPAID